MSRAVQASSHDQTLLTAIYVALASTAVMVALAHLAILALSLVMTRAAVTHAPVWVTADTVLPEETAKSAVRVSSQMRIAQPVKHVLTWDLAITQLLGGRVKSALLVITPSANSPRQTGVLVMTVQSASSVMAVNASALMATTTHR